MKELLTSISRKRGDANLLEVEGHVDGVDQGVVRGWAASKSHPDERLEVQVLVDGHVAARGIAALPRGDLHAAGWGDGHHGFEIRLPFALLDGRDHDVRAIEARSGRVLSDHSTRRRLSRHSLVGTSCIDLLFDPEFYRCQTSIDDFRLDHYRRSGWRSGFDPHPLFSTKLYLKLWPDAAKSDPLTHFEETGQFARKTTHPLFDVSLMPVGGGRHPIIEYLQMPAESRPPVSKLFSDEHYLRQVDPRRSQLSPILHYLQFGHHEDRSPSSGFHPHLFRRLTKLPQSIDPFTYFVESLPISSVKAAAAIAPRTSIIVLNYNKSLLTLQCLRWIRTAVAPGCSEIIVVDNGSSVEEFEFLSRHAGEATIVRLDCNRGFGEGCNIGAEHARGRYLLFLNNDAFLTGGCLAALEGVLDTHPDVAAAGPKLVYPDGRLQEAGASISACGTAVQFGRGLDAGHPAFNVERSVDYCSAAALLVRAESFRKVMGFDPCWDPAYYEDADLCLRLRIEGERTCYVPSATVIHLEHATASDPVLQLSMSDVVEANRLKFVGRWSRHLSGADMFATSTFAAVPRARSDAPRRTLGLFTPYPLVPGGGERYLMTLGEALQDDYSVMVQTPSRYSRFRIDHLCRYLSISIAHLDVETHDNRFVRPRFDLFIAMGNHLFPSVPAYGERAFYHCQFPFPMSAEQAVAYRQNLGTYQGIIVNSKFTADAIMRQAGERGVELPPVHILAPPVPQIGPGPPNAKASPAILSVGRFAPGGHCKRQDAMITEFRRLVDRIEAPIVLHLAGALGSDRQARAYLHHLIKEARDLPVRFHVDPSASQLIDLYRDASVYWHLTGSGQDLDAHPELAEHFGIALVEAMSSATVPVALNAGGPAEIISDGVDGILIDEAHQLASQTAYLLRDPSGRSELASRAVARAGEYRPSVFRQGIRRIVGSR